nr:MAG TPA: hypothetical protein [Caudoviricetes sp.]
MYIHTIVEFLPSVKKFFYLLRFSVDYFRILFYTQFRKEVI